MVIWITGLSGSGKTTLATGYPHSGTHMNLLQTHAVSDLRESLGWEK